MNIFLCLKKIIEALKRKDIYSNDERNYSKAMHKFIFATNEIPNNTLVKFSENRFFRSNINNGLTKLNLMMNKYKTVKKNSQKYFY